MTRPVTDDDIRAYHPVLHKLARRLTGRSGAEYDDLYQEGAVYVFTTLENYRLPSGDLIEKRMQNWCRKLERWKTVEYPVGLFPEAALEQPLLP